MKYLILLLALSFLSQRSSFAQVETINETVTASKLSNRSSAWTIEAISHIDSGAVALYTSTEKIKLLPGFQVEKGANFKAFIQEVEPVVVSLTAFPNPFSEILTIEFNLNEAANVSLSMYDMNGRVMERVISDEFTEKGLVRKLVDASNYTAGTYLISLNSRTFVKTIKAIRR